MLSVILMHIATLGTDGKCYCEHAERDTARRRLQAAKGKSRIPTLIIVHLVIAKFHSE